MRFWLLTLILLVTVIARAHDPELSGIGISVSGHTTTIAAEAPLTKLDPKDPAKDFARRLHLTVNGKPYAPSHPNFFKDSELGIASWTDEINGAAVAVAVGQRLFPESAGSRTIVRVTQVGKEVSEVMVDRLHPSTKWRAGDRQSNWDVIRQFLWLGVTHIFTGPDHILFIMGLILLGGSLKTLIKIVTAFTLAHSITLSVAATGLWIPPSRYVEPLIALSIVAVAIENLRPRGEGKDFRAWIGFAFGLIHGFGFAGGVTEAGIPVGALGYALASFNIGVEAAQASIVLAIAPILALIAAKNGNLNRRIVLVSSVAISLMGAFWFVDRVGLQQNILPPVEHSSSRN